MIKVLIFFTGFFCSSLFCQNLPESINDISAFDEHTFGHSYRAYFVLIRRIENIDGILGYGENCDRLASECFAYAYFQKPSAIMGATVDSISINGLSMEFKIAPVTGFKYYRSIHSFPIDTVLSPYINWFVKGGSDFPTYITNSPLSDFQFPDFYCIDTGPNEIYQLSGNDVNFTCRKINGNIGFTLPQPDCLQMFLYLPKAEIENKELQSWNREPVYNVSENSYTYNEPGGDLKMWPFRNTSGEIRTGLGSMVVRTYKFKEVMVRFPETNTIQKWLFTTVVESEKPVTFR